MDENKYYEYKEKLESLKKKLIIGLIIGLVFGIYVSAPMDGIAFKIMGVILMPIFFSGIVYTWQILPFTALNFMGLAFKFIVSVTLGWIIGPVTFIYYLARIKSYEKKNSIVNQKE